MKIIHILLDIIFPSVCLACGTRGVLLCTPCLAQAPQAERESETWIFPLFDYRHPPIKKAIHLLKYRGKRPLAATFGEALYGRLLEELGDQAQMTNFQSPLLIPIPLSPKRHRERGFNQSELLCRELIRLIGVEPNMCLNTHILLKPKDTVHQAHIENRSQRIKNLVGSFATDTEKDIKGRNIILIDDVTTTGATLREARKTLRAAGARRVIAFTIAH